MAQKSNANFGWSNEECKQNLDTTLETFKIYFTLKIEERQSLKKDLLLICKQLVVIFPVSALNENLFYNLLPVIDATASQILKEISLLFLKEATCAKIVSSFLQDLIALLDCFCICFEAFSNVCIVELDHVSTLLLTTLFICYKILAFYEDCRNSKLFTDVKDLLSSLVNQTNALLKSFIQLWNKIQIDNSTEHNVNTIVRVCSLLNNICQTFEVISGKSPVALWKTNINTLLKHCDAIKDRVSVEDTINLLCKNVGNRLSGLGTALSELALDEETNVSQSIKLCGFNLKILFNLIEKYKRYLGNCFEKLLDVILCLYEYSAPSLTALEVPRSLEDDLRRNVCIVNEPLISILLNEEEFISLVSLKSRASQRTAYSWTMLYLFILENLYKLPENLQNYLLPSMNSYLDKDFNIVSRNLLQDFFDTFSECAVEISLPVNLPGVMCQAKQHCFIHFYEYCCISINNFVIGISSEQFLLLESVLLSNWLSEDVWKSMLAADVWVFLGRIESPELCFSHCCLLADLIIGLCGQQKSITRAMRLGLTLKRLFDILAGEHKVTQDYWKLFILKYHPTVTPDLWMSIGFKCLAESLCSLQNELISHAVLQVQKHMEFNLNANYNESLIYLNKVITILRSLTDTADENDKSVHLKICFQLWQCIPMELIRCCEVADIFISNIIVSIKCLYDTTPNNFMLKILSIMATLQEKSSSFIVRYNILKFVCSYGKMLKATNKEYDNILDYISKILSECLEEDNPVLLHLGLEEFSEFSKRTPHVLIISKSLQKPKLKNIVASFLNKVPIYSSISSTSVEKQLLLTQRQTNFSSTSLKENEKKVEEFVLHPIQEALKILEDGINKLNGLTIPRSTSAIAIQTQIIAIKDKFNDIIQKPS